MINSKADDAGCLWYNSVYDFLEPLRIDAEPGCWIGSAGSRTIKDREESSKDAIIYN